MAPSQSPVDETSLRASVYNPEYLLRQSRWIRDDLDLQVARDGPDALSSNDILSLDEFLRRLLNSNLSLDDIRFSRIHHAVETISGKATRWPIKLINRADALKSMWEKHYGPLRELTPPLYESGGRLHGIARPEDVTNEILLVKWLKAPGFKVGPQAARKRGDLGFRPGDWWISPIFALQSGIIESADPTRGITFDAHGAYAVLMTDHEETHAGSPDAFTYRCADRTRGRYRLTAATPESRLPVRILRAHSLRSLWAPKAGVRYDGLHRIAGWSIYRDSKSQGMVYEIRFERLVTECSMDLVLRRPFADEIEDYKEYKRLRQLHRLQEVEVARTRPDLADGPTETDGASDLRGLWDDMVALDMVDGPWPLWAESLIDVQHSQTMRHRLPLDRSDSGL